MGIANIHRVRHLQTKTAPSQAWEAGSIPVFRSTLTGHSRTVPIVS